MKTRQYTSCYSNVKSCEVISACTDDPTLSVILPVYNEEGNLPLLHQSLTRRWSIWEKPMKLSTVTMGATIIPCNFTGTGCSGSAGQGYSSAENFGQTPQSTPELIIPVATSLSSWMPICRMILLISNTCCTAEEGYDIVSGWRKTAGPYS